MNESPVPNDLTNFVRACVTGKEGSLPFSKRSVSLEEAYYSKVTKQYIVDLEL